MTNFETYIRESLLNEMFNSVCWWQFNIEVVKFVCDRTEIIAGKEDNADYQHCLLFLQ